MKQFTMSMYSSKEELYKAKAGYYQKQFELLNNYLDACKDESAFRAEAINKRDGTIKQLQKRIRALEKNVCEHDKGLNDYCQPCGRIHNS